MISVILNTAEGCGKISPRDKAKFYSIARGSLLEVSAGLDVAHVIGRLSDIQYETLQNEILITTQNVLQTHQSNPNPIIFMMIVILIFGLIKIVNPNPNRPFVASQ